MLELWPVVEKKSERLREVGMLKWIYYVRLENPKAD